MPLQRDPNRDALLERINELEEALDEAHDDTNRLEEKVEELQAQLFEPTQLERAVKKLVGCIENVLGPERAVVEPLLVFRCRRAIEDVKAELEG